MGKSEELVLFWHRAGNDAEGLNAVLSQTTRLHGRTLRHAVECDLKWDLEGREPLLFFHHGLTGLSRPRRSKVEARGWLTLDQLLARPRADELDYMFEMKGGRGSSREAVTRLVRAMEDRGLGHRFVIAASSLPLLRDLRRDNEALLLGLFVVHTRIDGLVVNVPFIDLPRSVSAAGTLRPVDLGGIDVVVGSGPLGRGESVWRPAMEGLTLIPGPIGGVEGVERLAREGSQSGFIYFNARTPLIGSPFG